MLTQTEAQMYPAGGRGETHGQGFRSLHTLNFGSFQAEGKKAFGRLVTFNEEALAPGAETPIVCSRPIEVVLLPVAGGIELVDGEGESVFVGIGETFHFAVFPESDFRICNPYPEEQIAYIQLHLSPALLSGRETPAPLTTFSLDTPDVLIPVFGDGQESVKGFFGKYGGRQEGLYNPQSSSNGLFIFIIQGAFEVQNRLLEAGDALSLSQVDELEFEALSNDAIIFIVELDSRVLP